MSSDEDRESLSASGEVRPVSEPLELMPLLKRVSRAFYLSIRVLPSTLREPVGLAYLLARAADTITDTEALSPEERLDGLLAFREVVKCGRAGGGLARSLVTRFPSISSPHPNIICLNRFPARSTDSPSYPGDRYLVTDIVTRLTDGMEFDLTRFPT